MFFEMVQTEYTNLRVTYTQMVGTTVFCFEQHFSDNIARGQILFMDVN